MGFYSRDPGASDGRTGAAPVRNIALAVKRKGKSVCVMDPRRDRRLYWITENLHRGITSGTLVRTEFNFANRSPSVLQKHGRGISMRTHIIALLSRLCRATAGLHEFRPFAGGRSTCFVHRKPIYSAQWHFFSHIRRCRRPREQPLRANHTASRSPSFTVWTHNWSGVNDEIQKRSNRW